MMILPVRTQKSECDALSYLKRQRLYRALSVWMVTIACGASHALVEPVFAAEPAASSLPAPNVAVNRQSIGTAGPDQSGQQGNASDSEVYSLASGNVASSIYLLSAGGTGGTGQDGGDPTGNGGQGGPSAQVTLTLQGGSGVNSAISSASGPNAAVWLQSNGGNGGTAGQMLSSDGIPGQPGAGGNSYSTLLDQYATVISSSGWSGSQPGTTAILMQVSGGNAAEPLGNDGSQGVGKVKGPAGNSGGGGGHVVYNLHSGDVVSQGSAIVLLSQGGQGGDGTGSYSDLGIGVGGNGGPGGNGGNIEATLGGFGAPTSNVSAVGASKAATGAVVPIDPNGDTAQTAVMAAGIQAQSIGGLGGSGGLGDGTVGSAGSGGAAGAAGAVNINLADVNITTKGFAAAGALAQSIGGAGGNGSGAGGIFYKKGGNGAEGGAAGPVNVSMGNSSNTSWPSDLVTTSGNDSMGVVAQSIGGGGGAGGAVTTGSAIAGIAIGGDAESGGTGGVVTLNNGGQATTASDGAAVTEAGFIVSTKGAHASGLVAQSIGGGGGTGGSASNTSLGPFNYTVGGNGGSGGAAGTQGTTQVSVENYGIVSTEGNHAKGVVAQAVGGGGGDGGGSSALDVSGALNINVSVGGDGGKGGAAGDVDATNGGEILTSGSDAWGLLAQSVAGGGGNGGESKAEAFTLGIPDVPTLVINASVGGTGGDASWSGNVTANNTQLIMTAGAAAYGVLAQSVAGGGGNGGDSSAVTTGAGLGEGTGVDVTVSVGGNGGAGGTAGNVNVNNSANALIWTLGDSADGIYAQSVAGGGGSGGSSKDDSYFVGQSSAKPSQVKLTLGGSGGAGSSAGGVDVNNAGNILTMGDSANGIFAQSVGGGGGRGTGGASKGSIGKTNLTVTVAGTSGAPGNGNVVNVTNQGNIVTYGGDAAGVYAQSVGGGGGKAGTGATAGLPSSANALSDYFKSSAALKSLLSSYEGVTAWQPNSWNASASQLQQWAADYLGYAAAQPSGTPADATGGEIDSDIYLGAGANGSGNKNNGATQGDGLVVGVINQGLIQTFGPGSDGIFAQSVGAGGGQGGSVAANQLAATHGNIATANIVVGGADIDALGDSWGTTVDNNSVIKTAGDGSFGVFAQSIGGGGGEVTVTASDYASSTGGTPISISLGGTNGVTGNGGTVTVTNGSSGGSTGVISTTGNDAVGMVAQSIGGGGGNVLVMQTTSTAGGQAMSNTNPLADASGSLNTVNVGNNVQTSEVSQNCNSYNLYSACGVGGDIYVSQYGSSSTSTAGRDAYGMLAQSIGGGGGWIAGLTEQDKSPFNQPLMGGNGGNVSISLSGTINTTGAGAYGVLAQTVGGGGILGGDLAAAGAPLDFAHSLWQGGSWSRAGSGGNISIANTGSIKTTGANAHAIFAQSVGGGGGVWSTTGGEFMGTVGGNGNAGNIGIANSGVIQATGAGSSAIYTNAQGKNNQSIVGITNSSGGWIVGNPSAPAILLTGGNSNGDGSVVNSGTIWNMQGVAVAATSTPSSFAVVTNNVGGTIYGDLNIGSQGTLNNSGSWGTNATSTVGTVNNTGYLNINGGNNDSTTAQSLLVGTLNNSGTIQVSVDMYNKQSGSLSVTNNVNLENGSVIYLNPKSLMPNVPVAFMDAAAFTGITPSVTDAGNNFLFKYSLLAQGGGEYGETLSVQALNQFPWFGPLAEKYTSDSNLQAVGAYLDLKWDGVDGAISEPLAQIYGRLSAISNGAQYVNALQAWNIEGAQAAVVAHVAASAAFVERMNSCPRFDDGDLFQHEHDCLWGRAIGNNTDRDAGGDSVGYRQNGQVFQLGGQKEVAPDWFVGSSVSADHSSLSTDTVSSSLSGQGWTAGLIAKHQMGDWLVSATLEGGEMSYDSKRLAQLYDLGGTAQAKFDVTHWGLHSRISRQFAFDHFYLKPYVDLHALRVSSDGYTEQGAGPLDLRVAGSQTNVFGASPMFEAGSKFDFGNDMALQVYAGVGGTFYNQSNLGANMQFADAPGPTNFNQTSELPRDRFKTTTGLDLKTGDHWDVRLEYTGEFADRFNSNTGSVKFTYKF